jgi:hypothetical protein
MAQAGVQPVKAVKVISDGTRQLEWPQDVSAYTIVFTPKLAALQTAFSRVALQPDCV